MSGVLRRGSLNFDCNLNGRNTRGNTETNLYGGYRDAKPRTPEISVIALDFRRYSEDLKKDKDKDVMMGSPTTTAASVTTTEANGARDLSQDLDSDIISNFIGHNGRWQAIWTLMLTLFQIPPTFHLFVYTFQTASKDFWCTMPDNESNMEGPIWRNLSQPANACNIQLTSNSNTTIKCTQFDFSNIDGAGQTLVEEFGLVCERQYLVSVVEMCFLAGAAVGSVSSGWISDRFGRKHTLMALASVQIVVGALVAYSTNLAMYMTLRIITGFASMTLAVVSFVLVVELVSGRWRTIIGILNILPMPVSYVLMACIAYYVRDWRQLQLIISLPWLLLLSIWYCLPESPRWLLARGRLNELYALVERAARMNRRVLPPNYQKSLEAAAPPQRTSSAAAPAAPTKNTEEAPLGKVQQQQQLMTANGEQHQHNATSGGQCTNVTAETNPLKVVFNKYYWRTTCLNLIVWLTLVIIYYGLTLHLSDLGGDIYLNTIVAGTVEVISVLVSIFVVLKVGLRRSLIFYMLVPGVCCLATNFLPSRDENQMAVVALAIIAKCLIGANNAIIPSFTAMQYPTVVRNFGVGMGNLAAGVALILVPYMWLLERFDPLLPISIMGVSGIIGAIGLLLMKDVSQ